MRQLNVKSGRNFLGERGREKEERKVWRIKGDENFKKYDHVLKYYLFK